MPRSRFPIPSWPIGTSGSASWPSWTRREPRAQGHQRARAACHEGAGRADRVPHLLRRPVRAVAGRERGGHPARRRLRERGAGRRGVHALGGHRVQGRDEKTAERLKEDAKALEDAGAFAIVLELVPAPLASQITKSLTIPTIGIGAGPACDGQVLVLHDMLGLNDKFAAKFVKRYAALAEDVREAVRLFAAEVREGRYPGPEHSFAK